MVPSPAAHPDIASQCSRGKAGFNDQHARIILSYLLHKISQRGVSSRAHSASVPVAPSLLAAENFCFEAELFWLVPAWRTWVSCRGEVGELQGAMAGI